MIKEQCFDFGLPVPLFYFKSSGFWVEFRKDIYNYNQLKDLGLNDRQIKAVLFVKDNGKITNSEYQKINECSRNTASNDLAKLVEKVIFISSGVRGAGAFLYIEGYCTIIAQIAQK